MMQSDINPLVRASNSQMTVHQGTLLVHNDLGFRWPIPHSSLPLTVS